MNYNQLGPHHGFLRDEAVLVQAWKKTHEYIRRHNWYADTLELDLSTVTLRKTIDQWVRRFSEPEVYDYTPAPMRLVPAPKSARWQTPGQHLQHWNPREDWQPEVGDEKLRLRPLAHLRLPDQVIATTLMICLANCIESAQLPTMLPPPARGEFLAPAEAARRLGVVSYGNRLFCQWDGTKARFGWGNAHTYRKYYTDYRAFVQRSADVAKELDAPHVAVVQLDLEGFYDRIDRGHLLRILRKEAESFYSNDLNTGEFWKIAERAFGWRWEPADRPNLPDHMAEHEDRGLPQGLVASGFFANAYLLPFDRCMRACCKRSVTDRNWHVHDYCRYVDDLRLVISCSEPCDGRNLSAEVSDWVNDRLKETAPYQRINPKKTTVGFINQSATGVRVATAMEAIQVRASGPVDHQACIQLLQELDGLFPLAEQAALDKWAKVAEEVTKEPIAPPQTSDAKVIADAAILDIFVTDLDVKPETLERFAANRWRKAFRALRGFTDGSAGEAKPTPELKALDERALLFSKRLIRRWVQDPSLVALLRVAVDVYPNVENLHVILELLQGQIEQGRATSRRVAYYVAAELLRAGATETGFSRDDRVLPGNADLQGYRLTLAEFATYCLKRDVPWYVQQQALLYLATRRKRPTSIVESSLDSDLIAPYLRLHMVVTGKRVDAVLPPVDQPYYVLAHYVTGNATKVAKRFVKALEQVSQTAAIEGFEQLYFADPKLGARVWQMAQESTVHRSWCKESRLHRQLAARAIAMPEGHHEGTYSLTEIMRWDPNPLQHENAALLFFLRLLDAWKRDMEMDLSLTLPEIQVNCRDWSRVCDARLHEDKDFLRVECIYDKRIRRRAMDERYVLPSWCPPDEQWRFVAGRILRAAVTGQEDYSLHFQQPSMVIGCYRGVRTNWFKRQFGMSQSPAALGGPDAPMSEWLGELLMALLRWPGVREATGEMDWSMVDDRAKLAALVKKRLVHQADMFGASSRLPIYTTNVVANRTATTTKMTVVMAQTVLPRFGDYEAHANDLALNDPEFRIKHSRHLASVARLIEQTLVTRATFDRSTRADLIVLPELSVHPDDVPILERLVDRTRAIVFCGLVFHKRGGIGPLVNEGMWLIPDYRPEGRTIHRYLQGKKHMTEPERGFRITPHRPYQRIICGLDNDRHCLWRITGAICYDATDLRLAADLRDKTDAFIVPALNKDIPTFDHMVEALHYHMYQHFIMVNTGEFGGSTAQAPYKERHLKQIVHCHGTDQTAISICEVDLTHCLMPVVATDRPAMKHPPAGFNRLSVRIG